MALICYSFDVFKQLTQFIHEENKLVVNLRYRVNVRTWNFPELLID